MTGAVADRDTAGATEAPGFAGAGAADAPPKPVVAGVPLDPLSVEEVIEAVLARCARPAPPAGGPPLSVFSLNVDMAVKAGRNPEFRRLLASGSLVTADGMPIVWLGRALGVPVPERVAGSELVPLLCVRCAREGRSVYFLGAAPGVAARAAERLSRRAPGLRVAGVVSPPLGFDRDPAALDRVIAGVREAAPDVVFVALGAPKQERLIVEHGPAMGAKVLLGIGGSLDMAAGDVRRAPELLQRAGAEWLWRLSLEPRRLWRRYLWEDLPFAGIALGELIDRARGRR
jgi:N-acetylglucosaminyldiphosphoundecaprenol N-acetyl-beta-D-mannosaminyltransferase